jgi:Chlorophyllase enzyme
VVRWLSERRALVAAALVGWLAVACSAAPGPSTTTASTTTPTAVPVATEYPLAVESMPLVDPTRPVVSHGAELQPVRHLPLLVERPAASGRFPLVVFAAGFDTSPSDYGPLLGAIARRGYVVAAPSFPLEDPAQGNGLDRSDLPNEAGDLAVVVRGVLGSALSAHVEARTVVLLGHSDGADAVLRAAFAPGGAVPQAAEVIALAPDALDFTPVPGGPPALVVHGTADTEVDPAAAAQVVGALADRREDVTILGEDHASAVLGTTPLTPSVRRVILDGLGALGGRIGGLAQRLSRIPAVEVREVGPPA